MRRTWADLKGKIQRGRKEDKSNPITYWDDTEINDETALFSLMSVITTLQSSEGEMIKNKEKSGTCVLF